MSAWTFNTSGTLWASPTVADGIVYIGCVNFYFYALDANTGTVIWKYRTGGVSTSSAAVADGIVYLGSLDNNIYAFNGLTFILSQAATFIFFL